MNWPEYPGLRLSISFIIGIALGSIFEINIISSLFIVTLVVVSSIWLDSKQGLEDNTTLMISAALIISGLICGVTRASLQINKNDTFHYSHFKTDDYDTLTGIILEDIKRKNSLKTTVEVKTINRQNTRGKILVYFPQEDSLSHLATGDVIGFRSKIYNTRKNSNPNAFDYKSYLKNRGITFQTYLKNGMYHQLDQGKLWWPLQVTHDLRDRALVILEEKLNSKEQLATASAMILGYRDHISEDLYNAYATTGSVHVLAVSGLHVGIICWVFIALFRKIKSEMLTVRIMKASSLILLVWFYAILTGAAPAVIRASVMFTIMIIGKYWFDQQNIYNTLSLSAVLLLMFDPFLLYQASFQFSYLALLGIVFFHKIFYRLWEPRFVSLDYIWNLLVVAVAAQTLVFPVTIYYFHKFPLYFPLSGLFSVVLAFIILITGILVLLFSWVPMLGDILTYVLKLSLDSFIGIVYLIRDLPYSNLSGLWLSGSSTVLIYIGIISMMILYHNQEKVKLLYVLGLVIIGLIFNKTTYGANTSNQSELTLYEVTGATILDIFDGHKCYMLVSDSIDGATTAFATDNYRMSRSIDDVVPLESFKVKNQMRNGVIQFNREILYIPAIAENLDIVPQHSDVLMVTNSLDVWPLKIMNCHETDLIVIDKSIAWNRKQAWVNFAKKYDIPYYDIRERGAFIM